MKIKTRIVSALFACVMLLGIFSGCSKDNEKKNGVADSTEPLMERTQVLTNVFSGEEIILPDGLEIDNSIEPYCKDGKIRLLATREEGEKSRSYIYERELEGEDYTLTEVVLDDISISTGVFTDDEIVFKDYRYDMENEKSINNLYRYRISDSTVEIVENIQDMFPKLEKNEKIRINDIRVDSEGYIYIASETDVCVLNPDLTKAFVVEVPIFVVDLVSNGDKVYVTGYFSKSGIGLINKETRQLDLSIDIPKSIDATHFYFGEGYDIYCGTETGIVGYNFGEEAGEMVLNWENSNITFKSVRSVSVISLDTVLVWRFVSVNGDWSVNLMKRTPDVDMSSMKVIEVAYADDVPDNDKLLITEFNCTNPGIRVVIKDYSIYNNKENDYTGGMFRLVNDMINGLYTPDIVCDTGNKIISVMNKNGICADLYSFMETDPDVKKDDIIGCVRNTYEDNGKLIALCTKFSVNTLVAKKEAVGDRTSWTVDEMLDFIMSHGEYDKIMGYLTKKDVQAELMKANAFSAFVDMKAKKCNFESPAFMKYLSLVSALPDDTTPYRDYKNPRDVCLKGAAYIYSLDYRDMDDYQAERVPFNTDEVVKIGYPSNNKEVGGAIIDYGYSYAILSSSEHSNEAWQFIKMLLCQEVSFVKVSMGIPSLKSIIKDMKSFMKNIEIFYDYTGGRGARIGSYTLDEHGMDNGKPGVLVTYDEAKYDAFIEWLDSIGTPIAEEIPDEIMDIINEEISTFINGVKSAEDTARVIQSRVSILLSERS